MQAPDPDEAGVLQRRYERIIKPAAATLAVAPNLADYEALCRRFHWSDARAMLDGLPQGRGLNIAHEAVDRHAGGPRAGRAALRWLGRKGQIRVLSYRELAEETNRFANALRGLGVQPG